MVGHNIGDRSIHRWNWTTTDPGTERRPQSAAFALSTDGMLMAVATNKVIRMYTSWDKSLKSELVGHSKNVTKVFFAPKDHHHEESYILLSEAENYGEEKHNPS